jgi:hypothetical protein
MHGSASKIKATYPSRARFGRVGPMLSHLPAAGGTVKMGADWAFVSGVSPVSPNLKLIERIQKKKVGNGRKGISGGYAPCAETGGTGGTSQARVEVQRARPLNLATFVVCHGRQTHDRATRGATPKLRRS